MRITLTAAIAALLATTATLAHDFRNDGTVTPLRSHAFADMPGKAGTMLIVEYPPGGATDPHVHANTHTFVYVLEGAVEMQVRGGEPVTLGPGDTYYERPEDVHVLSRNASDTDPARFLVFFVQDEGAPAVTPWSPPSADSH